MSESNTHIDLFTTSGCLTQEALKRYSSDLLTNLQKEEVNGHLETCELCSDALEGMQLLSDPQKLDKIILEINENLKSNLIQHQSQKDKSQNRIYYFAAAASILILIVVFSYFRFYIQDQNTQLTGITEKSQPWENEDFKSATEEKSLEISIEKELDESIPSAAEKSNEKTEESLVEDQAAKPAEESKPVVEITMSEATVEETEAINAIQAIEEIVVEQPAAVAMTQESTEYVVDGISINGKGQDAERYAYDEDIAEEEEQYISRKDKRSANKKGKGNYATGSVSNNYYQDDTIQKEEEQIFMVVEKPPDFPGGNNAMLKFIAESLNYPDSAKSAGIEGVVHVSFIIKKSGKIDNVKLDLGIGSGCDEEALRIVKSMPNWIPGEQKGEPVAVRMTQQIKFELE